MFNLLFFNIEKYNENKNPSSLFILEMILFIIASNVSIIMMDASLYVYRNYTSIGKGVFGSLGTYLKTIYSLDTVSIMRMVFLSMVMFYLSAWLLSIFFKKNNFSMDDGISYLGTRSVLDLLTLFLRGFVLWLLYILSTTTMFYISQVILISIFIVLLWWNLSVLSRMTSMNRWTIFLSLIIISLGMQVARILINGIVDLLFQIVPV